MKLYEAAYSTTLPPKSPIIVRCDGRAFHTYTRRANKPWDDEVQNAMQCALFTLCRDVSGARFGYQQSDEITLILCDWADFNSEHYFGGKTQKLTSVISSQVTNAFNKSINPDIWGFAEFDCRVFSVPHHEIKNVFIWRQQDATRNSVQCLGQKYFSHHELHQKSIKQIKLMLSECHDIVWDQCPTKFKHGISCYKPRELAVPESRGTSGSPWLLDVETPIFSSPDAHDFITKHLPEP